MVDGLAVGAHEGEVLGARPVHGDRVAGDGLGFGEQVPDVRVVGVDAGVAPKQRCRIAVTVGRVQRLGMEKRQRFVVRVDLQLARQQRQ